MCFIRRQNFCSVLIYFMIFRMTERVNPFPTGIIFTLFCGELYAERVNPFPTDIILSFLIRK